MWLISCSVNYWMWTQKQKLKTAYIFYGTFIHFAHTYSYTDQRRDYLFSSVVSTLKIASNNYFKFIILPMLKCLIHHFSPPPHTHTPPLCMFMSYTSLRAHTWQWWCSTRYMKQSHHCLIKEKKKRKKKNKIISKINVKIFVFGEWRKRTYTITHNGFTNRAPF